MDRNSHPQSLPRVLQARFLGGGRPSPLLFGGGRPRMEVRGNAYALPPRFDLAPRLPGRPLAGAVLQRMEDLFGVRLPEVRIHTGPQPQALGAAAFTLGADIFFAPGHFCPEAVQGQKLLAHEISHVVQQRAGRVRNVFGHGVALVHDPVLEAEAERMGERVLRVRTTVVLPAAGRAPAPGGRTAPAATLQPRMAPGGLAGVAGTSRLPAPPPVPGCRLAQPARPAPVLQRSEKSSDSSSSSNGSRSQLDAIVRDARRARDLSSTKLRARLQTVNALLQNLGTYDTRRPIVERAYQAFMGALSNREAWRRRRSGMLTRIVRENQLVRKNIGINSIRKSQKSFTHNLGSSLRPEGKLTDPIQSLYSFMRTYGGAGIQGFHRISPKHLQAVRQALLKMAGKRETTSSRGPKFALVAVDRRELPSSSVMDLSEPSTENSFSEYYGPGGTHSKYSYMKMYNDHKSEGVVGVEGSISLDAIKGLRAFRWGEELSEEEIEEILRELLDQATDNAEFVITPFKKYDEDRDPPPMGGGILSF